MLTLQAKNPDRLQHPPVPSDHLVSALLVDAYRLLQDFATQVGWENLHFQDQQFVQHLASTLSTTHQSIQNKRPVVR